MILYRVLGESNMTINIAVLLIIKDQGLTVVSLSSSPSSSTSSPSSSSSSSLVYSTHENTRYSDSSNYK